MLATEEDRPPAEAVFSLHPVVASRDADKARTTDIRGQYSIY